MSALALSKTSVKSWYSSGIEEMPGGVDWDVEEAWAEMSLRLSVNCCVPSSSQARRKPTMLTREMSTFGVAVGVSGISRVGLSSQLSESEVSKDDCGSISLETVVCSWIWDSLCL